MRQKKREEQRQNSQTDRFRIVNCSRTTTTGDADGAQSSSSDAAAAKEITILDIEKHNGEEKAANPTSSSSNCASQQQQQLNGTEIDSGGVAGASSTHHSSMDTSASHGGDYVYDLYVPDVGQPELEWSEQFLENMLRFVPVVHGEINLIFSYTYF